MAKKNEASVTVKMFNQQFKQAAKELRSEASKLNQEFRLQQEQMKQTGTEVQKLEAKIEHLSKKQELSRKSVEQAESAYKRAVSLFGENSKAADDMGRALTNARIEEQKLANELTATQNALTRQKDNLKDLQTLFQATGTDVDRFADTLGTDLANAIKSGTATSKQLERAINQIGKEALGADVDLGKMKKALKTLDDGASLDKVRQDLNKLSADAKDAEKSVSGLGSELGNLAAGAAAGVGIGGIINQALSEADLKARIDISFEVPEESKKSVLEAVKGVQNYGIDAAEALEGVRRQWTLNKNASDESNAAVVKGASLVASAYEGIDFTELIQETNEIAAALEITNEDAIALTNSLLKAGFPPEQLDTISEYGTQMKEAGFSAAEIQHIFEKGIDTKTWN